MEAVVWAAVEEDAVDVEEEGGGGRVTWLGYHRGLLFYYPSAADGGVVGERVVSL